MIHVGYGVHIQADEVVLFPFDNYSAPFRCGLHLNLVEGAKQGVVLRGGESGEPDCERVSYYGTVIRIDGEFRMWHLGLGDQDDKIRICYAVSQDGVNWTKPNLGLVKYGGNANNNIVDLDFDFDGSTRGVVACVVLYEPEDPNPDRRFKMSYEEGDECKHCVAYSRDGLVWRNSPNNPVIKHTPLEQTGLIKYNGCYYVLGQGGNFSRRHLAVYASYDFEHWTEAAALGFRRDNIGPLRPRIYGWHTDEQVHLGAALWNRGNVIIGFYGQWHGPPPETDDRRFMSMDIGLVISHDAIHYHEPISDFKIIPSREENWPSALSAPRLTQGQGFENVGEKTYVWYGTWGPQHETGVRLATWPRDRFGYYAVSREATEGQYPPSGIQPHFISCPIQLDHLGGLIFVNADGLSEHSYITVEILDEKFRRLPCYSGDDCIPIKESGFRQPVIWRNKETLDKFEHPIHIQVNYGGLRLEDARVYAVYIK